MKNTASSQQDGAFVSPALFGEIFDEVPAGLIVLDGSGRVARNNRAAESLLGEALEGRLWREIIQRLFCLRPDDGHEVSLRNGRRVQISTHPLKQQQGQLIQITDLTETRRLQDQLSHMERLSALGKMAASLAHQIRTPLAAAMLYGANLANRTLSHDARGSFQKKLMDRLRDLEGQVSDVLLFARNGEQQVVSVIELTDLLGDLERGAEAMMQQAGASFSASLDQQQLHSLGLILVGWTLERHSSRWLLASGWLMVAGLVLFCLNIDARILWGWEATRAGVPWGGSAFILAWLCAAVGWGTRGP